MWKLTVESDLRNLSLHEKYFEYSTSYLNAAITFCKSLVEIEEKQTYPNGAVVLYLTFHATELFLKGAILKQYPDESLNSHKINEMKSRYRKIYPGRKYAIQFPFETEQSEIEIPKQNIQRIENFEFDQMYRYPIGRDGDEWQAKGMIPSFEATSFYKYLKYYQPKIAETINIIKIIG